MFYYFTKYNREGVFGDTMDSLREILCVLLGRDKSPSLGFVYTRTVKTIYHVDKERNIDDNKKMKGRKEQVVTDRASVGYFRLQGRMRIREQKFLIHDISH